MKIGLIPVNVGVKSVDQMVGLAQYAESLGGDPVAGLAKLGDEIIARW